jgi:hypothetical protein
MTSDKETMLCSEHSKDIALAMAYVPFQEWDPSINTPEEALRAGTLFPSLDKPFLGYRKGGDEK